METQTIERTDTDEQVDDGTDSDTPKFFHYVKKEKIAESAVMGTHVVALCGEVFPVTRGGQARFAGLPGLQADLRDPQEGLTGPGVAVGTGGVAASPTSVSCVGPCRCALGSRSHDRTWSAWVSGAGHSSSIAALSSAPIMIAKPRKNANSRNAIGVASAP